MSNLGQTLLIPARGAGGISTPAFRADNQTAPGVRSTLTISKPAGAIDNDLLVAAIVVDSNTTAAITAPAGWALIQDTLFNASAKHYSTFWKIAASEGASWDWLIESALNCGGWVGAYTGCKTTNVAAELVKSSNPNQAGVTNCVATAVTTAGLNSLLVGVWAAAGTRTFTPPGDMTEQYDAGGGPSHMIADSVQAAIGTTGTKTAVISSAAAGAAQLIAFRANGT